MDPLLPFVYWVEHGLASEEWSVLFIVGILIWVPIIFLEFLIRFGNFVIFYVFSSPALLLFIKSTFVILHNQIGTRVDIIYTCLVNFKCFKFDTGLLLIGTNIQSHLTVSYNNLCGLVTRILCQLIGWFLLCNISPSMLYKTH